MVEKEDELLTKETEMNMRAISSDSPTSSVEVAQDPFANYRRIADSAQKCTNEAPESQLLLPGFYRQPPPTFDCADDPA